MILNSTLNFIGGWAVKSILSALIKKREIISLLLSPILPRYWKLNPRPHACMLGKCSTTGLDPQPKEMTKLLRIGVYILRTILKKCDSILHTFTMYFLLCVMIKCI